MGVCIKPPSACEMLPELGSCIRTGLQREKKKTRTAHNHIKRKSENREHPIAKGEARSVGSYP